jgi:PAS domain S-box-containing protein
MMGDQMLIQKDYFRNIFNTVREAILILDENMRVLSANRSFFTIFKVDSSDSIGSLLYDLGNGQWNIPHLRVLIEDVLPENNSVDDYEIEHNFESIGQKTMLLNACKIREKNNDRPMILLAIEDITERRRLEDLLTESETRYRRIFETASDGIVLLEKSEGTIIQTNSAVGKMLGYSEEESIGKNLQDIGVPLGMSDFPAIMQDLDKYGILNYVDVMVKTKSGQSIDTDIYMVDRATLAQCNIRNVTERKLEEEKLRKSEEFTKSILESVDEGFIVIDLEYRVIAANRAYLNSVGKPLEEVKGKHCYELSHHIDKPCCEEGTTVCPVTLTFKTGEHYSSIHTHYDNTGAPVYVEVKSYPLKDKSGKIVSAIEIINDITEKKKLETQLRHSQKMEAVGTLAGGIAHDFNNILNVIIGYGAMVLDRIGEDQLSREQMNEVLSAADRAANLTKRLLAFSRRQVVDMKPVSVNEIIFGMEKMLSRIIGEDIVFSMELTDKKMVVLADSGQIEQVLMNLISNARDAMPKGGRLLISTETREVDDYYITAYGYGRTGMYALISVTDTGSGMDAETREKIFEPFFTTKGVGEGTGLGLAIAYGIIRQHDGYIKVYSEEGKGTTFKILLPVISEESSKRQEAEAGAPIQGGTETILIAEDDAALRKLSRIVLESFGYSVITAADGEEAITRYKEHREKIQLLILDMIMPKKSGKEAYEEIRKLSPDIRVLFASGYTMDILSKKELLGEDMAFMAKPVTPKDLLRTVREVLDK